MIKGGQFYGQKEFLNYIIDFAMDTEWEDLKRREQLRALFTSWCFIFGIDADTKECDDTLGVICFRAAFEMVEEFENYMVELIVQRKVKIMERHINGMITNNYSGGIDVGSYDFSDFMYDFADGVGFAKHHNKGLGGKKALIENCNIRMYFTDKECDLDEAEIALLIKLEVKGFLKTMRKRKYLKEDLI